MLSGKQHPQKQQRWIARKRTTTKSPGKAGVLQTKGNMRTQKPPPYTCLPEPHCSPTSHEKPHAKRCCSSRVVRALKKGTKPTKPMMSRASSAKGPGLESARCRRRRRAPGSLQLLHQQCRRAKLHPGVPNQLLSCNTDQHFTCHCLIFQPLGRFRCLPFIETFGFQHGFRPVTYLQAAWTRNSSKRHCQSPAPL